MKRSGPSGPSPSLPDRQSTPIVQLRKLPRRGYLKERLGRILRFTQRHNPAMKFQPGTRSM